jgi:hypothetical protein
MTKLKSSTDEDVGVASTSRAGLRKHVLGVAAVPGTASSMITLVIPPRRFFQLPKVLNKIKT